MVPETENDIGWPAMVQQFHSLFPLDNPSDVLMADDHPSQALGVSTAVVKGINSVDGGAYALRRIDGRQVGAVLDFQGFS